MVEDDSSVRLLVSWALRDEGFELLAACDGEEALDRVERDSPHLIILDLMLPKVDGFEVCRRIRKKWTTPILMLTARSTETDKVRGLELGADDYLTKPFGLRELVARVKALLRRAAPEDLILGPKITVGGLNIDVERCTVTVDGRQVHLTPTEFRLLCQLASRPGEVLPSRRLVSLLYNYSCSDQEAYDLIRMNVSRLRQKIEPDPAAPRFIRTVRGFGYTLVGAGGKSSDGFAGNPPANGRRPVFTATTEIDSAVSPARA